MENVPQAPTPAIEGYAVKDFVLNNCWIPGEDGLGQEQERKRRFSFGVRGADAAPNLMRWIEVAALLLPETSRPVTAMHDHPDNVTAWSKMRRKAVCSNTRPTRKEHRQRGRYTFADACRLQGLPEDFLSDAPFTAAGKLKAVANGVPIPMGRAVARAVVEALKR